jgi:IS1 family transposase
MNKLSHDKQALVLSQLVEGSSIRSIERITGIHRDTIMRLMIRAGDRSAEIMDKHLVNIQSERIQLDEIWGYVGKKQRRLTEYDPEEFGDNYTFVAIDSDSKLVPAFRVGKRDGRNAVAMLRQLKRRVTSYFELSTDSWGPYPNAIRDVFGVHSIAYGQVHKSYGEGGDGGERRYSPANLLRVTLRVIFGDMERTDISTSYVERQNLTMRMGMRRLTRLTNAWSKKLDNLRAAVNLHFYHYNLMRLHSSIGCTPAQKAGIAHGVWEWATIIR